MSASHLFTISACIICLDAKEIQAVHPVSPHADDSGDQRLSVGYGTQHLKQLPVVGSEGGLHYIRSTLLVQTDQNCILIVFF